MSTIHTPFVSTNNMDSDRPKVSVRELELSDTNEPLSRTSFESFNSTSHKHSPLGFCPTQSVRISARGLSVFHAPGPSPEITIPVFYPNGATKFLAMRPNRWSATLTLQDPNGRDLALVESDRLSHFELRSAIHINVFGEWMKMKRKGIMTRSCTFECRGEEWEWRYGRKEEGARMNGHTLLVLEKTKSDGTKEKVAELIRDEKEDEKLGSTRFGAGRGGRLDMAVDVDDERVEVMIVVTALEMLKKEIDRRRHAHPFPITPCF